MISFYINHMVKKQLSKKNNPKYEESLNYEISKLKRKNMKIYLEGFEKPWLNIETKFGNLDLYKHGNSNKEIVIFVHGIKCTNRTVVKTLDYYISRNIDVISYDNFGWGKNRAKNRGTFGIKESILLKEIVEVIKNKYPNTKIHLHGESMGGGTIYKFIDRYKQDNIESFFIDAGYYNFLANVMYFANKKIPLISYLSYPMLVFLFFLEGFPIKKLVKHKKLKNIKNITHVHSKNDKLVAFKTIKKYKKNIGLYTYKNPNIRHVRGYYECKDELYYVLDKHYKIN